MELTDRIVKFIETIGLPCRPGPVPDATVLPGILIENGGIVYDLAKLRYPGDLLHEAGHLAVMSPERRQRARPDVGKYAAEEMMAIAWSYAAAVHLDLDPAVVFHEDGYRGGSASILESFAAPSPVGVPMLRWFGMTTGDFPVMTRWLYDGSCAAANQQFR
jgi:hypothetical protein